MNYIKYFCDHQFITDVIVSQLLACTIYSWQLATFC